MNDQEKEKSSFAKNDEKSRNIYNTNIVVGLLLIASGIYFLFLPILSEKNQSDFNNFLLLITGIYFIICFVLLKVHKIFLFLGGMLVVFWIGTILEVASRRYILPIALLVLGMIMIIYATYYTKQIKKKEKINIKLLIPGIILALIGLVLLFTVLNILEFQFMWMLIRPFILILFGIILIQRWYWDRKLSKNENNENNEENTSK